MRLTYLLLAVGAPLLGACGEERSNREPLGRASLQMPTFEVPDSAGDAEQVEREARASTRAELAALWRGATEIGETVSEEEHVRLEEAIRSFLPVCEGELAGFSWDVTYHDFEESIDFFSVELLPEGAGFGESVMWFHLLLHPELDEWMREHFGFEAFGDYRGMGAENQHYFVLAGSVEVRAVASREDFQNDARIKSVLADFRLDDFASL